MKRNKVPIILRAHHLLCFLGFRGLGYSKEFVENFKSIYKRVYLENSHIKIVSFPDRICRCCPNLTAAGCRFEEKVKMYDEKVMELLKVYGLSDLEDVLPSEAYSALKKVLPQQLESICRTCEWFVLGFCRESFYRKDLWKNG
uniref:DUF1284 domain-containing protein n=1 Tax=Caldicellulosiruptor owensensis TaxID=55205 RepID=A0A7C5V4I8_9FIRM